jgi:ribosomal protein L37E
VRTRARACTHTCECASHLDKEDRVLERAEGRCERCGERRATQVHHLTYRRVGAEAFRDLLAICNACHERHHPHMPRTFKERWAAATNPTWERT